LEGRFLFVQVFPKHASGTLHAKQSLAVTGGLKHSLEKVHDLVEKSCAGNGVAG
jgi:hypothetical protein